MDKFVLFTNPAIVMAIGIFVYFWSKKRIIDLSHLGLYITSIGAAYFIAALFIHIIYQTLGC